MVILEVKSTCDKGELTTQLKHLKGVNKVEFVKETDESYIFNVYSEKGIDLRQTTAQQVMHPKPSTVACDALAVEAAELMELHCITSVLVLDAKGQLCGALNSNDLMRAKVI